MALSSSGVSSVLYLTVSPYLSSLVTRSKPASPWRFLPSLYRAPHRSARSAHSLRGGAASPATAVAQSLRVCTTGKVRTSSSKIPGFKSPFSTTWRRRFDSAHLARSSSAEGVESPGAVLQFDQPLALVANVVHGFGRGSRQMGFPTANLDPEQLKFELEGLERGVYCGFAQVPALGSQVHPMVCNIGLRPSFADGAGTSIEIHILHQFDLDFYGEEIRALLLGYVRPEKKFDSLDALRTQISADILKARSTLDCEDFKTHTTHPVFH